jgi:RHS repeat-associated protein
MCNFANQKQENMSQTYQKYNTKTLTKYPQTFTGKERDSETGFSYFGARYYDSDLMTGWLSVDPMADKYPSLSPYAYCGWNPTNELMSTA